MILEAHSMGTPSSGARQRQSNKHTTAARAKSVNGACMQARTVEKVNYKAGIVGTRKSWQNAHQIRCFLKKGQKDTKASKSAADFTDAK